MCLPVKLIELIKKIVIPHRRKLKFETILDAFDKYSDKFFIILENDAKNALKYTIASKEQRKGKREKAEN